MFFFTTLRLQLQNLLIIARTLKRIKQWIPLKLLDALHSLPPHPYWEPVTAQETLPVRHACGGGRIVSMFLLLRTELLILLSQSPCPHLVLSASHYLWVKFRKLSFENSGNTWPFFSFKIYTWTQDSTEYTMLVWNVTPAFQCRALNSIHLCFSVATRSLAAFTDTHSCFYCASFFFVKPPEVIR